MFGRTLHDRLEALVRGPRPHEPRCSDAGLGLAEERYVPGEDEAIESLLEAFAERLEKVPVAREATGSTPHGLVRAELVTASDLPQRCRKGIFAEPRTYPAWARFHGSDPDGVCGPSLDVKLSNVPGAKLLDDEKHTQDLCCIGTPTPPTASVLDSAQLESWRRRQTPLFYFIDPRHQHLLELLKHTLYAEPVGNPLERRYYGSGPLLLGQGQAMMISLRPRVNGALGEPMVNRLASEDVLFDLLIQLQTDPHAMPIEDATVRWPERLSPWLVAGTLRIFKQPLDSPELLAFARQLRFTPWHALTDHRPLGSQNRARRRLYQELLAVEQQRAPEQVRHVEPTADAEPSAAPEPAAQTDERIARSATRPTRGGAVPELAAARRRG